MALISPFAGLPLGKSLQAAKQALDSGKPGFDPHRVERRSTWNAHLHGNHVDHCKPRDEMSGPSNEERIRKLAESSILVLVLLSLVVRAHRAPRDLVQLATLASSSGWSTTLSCSFGSVRAAITTMGSVLLRLTATCETPAGT